MATVPLAATPGVAATTRTRTGRLPSITIDKLLAILAAVLFPTGLLTILLGWWGAAHTPFLFEQIPYLISGGLLGLGLVAVGGLLYFGSWVLRLAAQQRESSDMLRVALQELREGMALAAFAPPPPVGVAAAGAVPAPAAAGGYVATANGSMYHLPSCAVVDGIGGLREVGATTAATMRPCRLCLPGA